MTHSKLTKTELKTMSTTTDDETQTQQVGNDTFNIQHLCFIEYFRITSKSHMVVVSRAHKIFPRLL